MSHLVDHLAACNCLLGEGPVWLAKRQELVFVDILGKSLLFWNAEAGLRHLSLTQKVGSFVRWTSSGFLAASARGLFHLDMETGAFSDIGKSRVIPEGTLMNDGKCDRGGRFVFGSKDVNETDQIGKLMSFSGDPIKHLAAACILNGPAFSPQGDRIYYADSPTRNIFVADYDAATGAILHPEVFATIPEKSGYPDGMTVDSEGYLWNAQWDGWCISRYHPDGTKTDEIEMPVSRPTSVAFGGADMKTMFITSARQGTETGPMATEPGAGDLFSVTLEIAGLQEQEFSGEFHA